ncbi:MAG: hypothetical protein JRD93_08635 [Deltaproteobacteria bacterium]|nr:hypothetical protein [Deltaproteobacteria bacterium]
MGNFSRDTFDKLKHYVGVRLQQGVPLVDADWNEQEDIRKYELQAFLKWFVGNGVPKGNDGFCIEAIPAENDFWIKGGDGTPEGAGRCLVEGWDAINESNLKYTAQPLFNNPALAAKWGVDPVQPLTAPTIGRKDIVYLDVWEREVDAEEVENLVNPAIGIETCVRLKREWAVRVAEGAPPPEPPRGHVFFPLACLRREGGEAMIRPQDITDLRTTGLNMAALEIGNDHVKADAAIEESKILFSRRGHDHRDGSQGKRIKHSSLHKDDGSNPHGTTAADIDKQDGHNRIVAQINAGGGVIDKKNIDPAAGLRGWVRLPFLPKKYLTGTEEFIHNYAFSMSGTKGAVGNMGIPVPPGATRMKNFRIAGTKNAVSIFIELHIIKLYSIEKTFRFKIEGFPFDELFIIDRTINAETGYIVVKVEAGGFSEIWFVASQFE